jgi:hypothetical protein
MARHSGVPIGQDALDVFANDLAIGPIECLQPFPDRRTTGG